MPLAIRKRGGRKCVIAPAGDQHSPLPRPQRPESTLIKAIARAYRWQRLLEGGTYATMRELATAEKISSTYISRLMQLTLLSPDRVEAILSGKEQSCFGINFGQGLSSLWSEQRSEERR